MKEHNPVNAKSRETLIPQMASAENIADPLAIETVEECSTSNLPHFSVYPVFPCFGIAINPLFYLGSMFGLCSKKPHAFWTGVMGTVMFAIVMSTHFCCFLSKQALEFPIRMISLFGVYDRFSIIEH